MNREERGTFLVDLMCRHVHPLQPATHLAGLPAERFDEVISVLARSPVLLASILSWMTSQGQQRVASSAVPAELGRAYDLLTEADLKRMACPVLLGWGKPLQKASNEKWKYGVGYVMSRDEWNVYPQGVRAGVALHMTDQQLDQLQEILK